MCRYSSHLLRVIEQYNLAHSSINLSNHDTYTQLFYCRYTGQRVLAGIRTTGEFLAKLFCLRIPFAYECTLLM